MRRLVLFGVGAFLLAGLLIVGMSVSSQAAEPVVIGSISPLTGTNAVQGLDMKRGEELALEEINSAGGINGRPLKIIWEDTESSAKGGMDAVHKLVEINK
ncbi:MAG: ABC transporter substrate-binding protein, partial [Desulfatiglandales bacterium]